MKGLVLLAATAMLVLMPSVLTADDEEATGTTYTAKAGDLYPDESLAINQFLPSDITVVQGDTVVWDRVLFHTVTLLSGEPGLGKACAAWANSHDIMMWGLDQFAIDPLPFETEGECLPMHIEMLSKSGIRLIENVYLEEIVREKVYEFCVIGAPLRFKGGTGSPIRLLAMI